MPKIGREQLVQLQKRYGSDQAIASLLNISRQMVFKLRKQYGIPAVSGRNDKRNREIKHLYSTGITPLQLAVRFSLSQAQVYRILDIPKESPMKKKIEPQVFRSSEALAETLQPLRKQGKSVVTTNGCFDILHAGHAQYLREAANCGDILIVGINSDASVRRLKGDDRPLQNEEDRATLIASLKAVDYAIIFEEDTPREFLTVIQPDIHVKGGDYLPEDLPEKSTVEQYGGEVVVLSFKDGCSTTSIVEKIQKQ